jgi:hypothetical protein
VIRFVLHTEIAESKLSLEQMAYLKEAGFNVVPLPELFR